MQAAKHCQRCGKRLSPQAADGLCPECLLKAGLDGGVVTHEGTNVMQTEAEPMPTNPEPGSASKKTCAAQPQRRNPRSGIARMLFGGTSVLLLALAIRLLVLNPLAEVGNLRTPAMPVRAMLAHLRAAGFEWDSAEVASKAGEEVAIWRFANLRRTKGGVQKAVQGKVRVVLANEPMWRVRGDKDLADLHFDLPGPSPAR